MIGEYGREPEETARTVVPARLVAVSSPTRRTVRGTLVRNWDDHNEFYPLQLRTTAGETIEIVSPECSATRELALILPMRIERPAPNAPMAQVEVTVTSARITSWLTRGCPTGAVRLLPSAYVPPPRARATQRAFLRNDMDQVSGELHVGEIVAVPRRPASVPARPGYTWISSFDASYAPTSALEMLP